MQGLNWQTMQLSFSAGLQQRADDRARPSPFLDVATDVQFDEVGGLQTRFSYEALPTSILGGGTLSNYRRIFANGDELLLFTKDSLYSLSQRDSAWVLKATHLAVSTEETPRFVATGDQVDPDRAELGNAVVYAWTDGTSVYAAAIDKTTDAVIVAPTVVSVNASRPRLVALATKILLFFSDGSPVTLAVMTIDPASIAASLAAPYFTVVSDPDFNSYYDVVKVPGADTAIGVSRRSPTTSYEIFTVSAAAVVLNSVTKARTCDGPIAISCDPTGATAQVVRANSTNIQGDRITVSSLADAATGQAIGTVAGTPVNQIAAAHRSVQNGGQYRCYAFWSSQEDAGSGVFFTKSNYVDTGGTIGTQANFVSQLGVASRAFDYNGEIYVWLAFGKNAAAAGGTPDESVRGQFQNAYYLFRDDQLLVSKAVHQVAGGLATSTGRLPGVASTDGGFTSYAWCTTERRLITLGGTEQTGYGDRGPRDIAFTFDDNSARRCARVGRTVIVTGGLILQYDGNGLVELGFLIYPWFIAAIASGAGNLANGAYTYKPTYRWQNAQGEEERSTTATSLTLTVSAGPKKVLFGGGVAPLNVTRKTTASRRPAIEIWRTAVNPPQGAPFYLDTSVDPGVLSGDNRYIANDHTAVSSLTGDDNFADSTLTKREQNPENEGVLEDLAPPAATLIATSDTRVFLAGVAGDPDRIWYSKQRSSGRLPAFHESLTFSVPREGGAITAIAAREDAVIVWRERATYVFSGIGYDNTGGGQNYGPVQTISVDVGAVSQETVAFTDRGYLFKSAKGWHVLAGLQLQYVGAPVADADNNEAYGASVIELQHQIRIVTDDLMLVFDTAVSQWAKWSVTDTIDATMWKGMHVVLTGTGALQSTQAYGSVTYGMDVETAWIKLADLQGAAAVSKIQPIGEWRSACGVRVRLAYDYRVDATGRPLYIDDKTWAATPSNVGDVLQFLHGPKRPRCQSVKVRLTAVATSTLSTATDMPPLVLSVGTWAATLTGYAPRALSIGLVAGSPAVIDVRDNERWVGTEWQPEPGTCGVKITGNNTTATVQIGQLEAAINADSKLVAVTVGHATPTRTIDMSIANAAFNDVIDTDVFAESSPSGEALKLTGLSLMVGNEGGIYRQMPPSGRQ